MSDKKINIPEDRANIYETITGSKPSDKVNVTKSASLNTNLNPNPKSNASLESFFSLLKIILISSSVVLTIIFIANYGKMVFDSNILFLKPVDCFKFLFKFLGNSSLVLLVMILITMCANFVINFIEFIIYTILIVSSKKDLDSKTEEMNANKENIKKELSKLDEEDKRKLQENKSVDFSDTL